ncbi:MAG: hypothetical protein HY332_14645 [Chloroflexi bacterium]|nr:hypothetical protein [Chloroflexota bacterium]
MKLREAPYALRLVHRADGEAAIVYRRAPKRGGRDRLQRVAALSPLALTAGDGLLRRAVRNGTLPAPAIGNGESDAGSVDRPARNGKDGGAWPPPVGPFQPLRADWGARVACYALVSRGLRDPARLGRAARRSQEMHGPDAAWWLALLTGEQAGRALRALRILVEAVA